MKNFFTGLGMLAVSIIVYFNLGIKLRPDLVAGGINEEFWPKTLLIILMVFSVLLIISGIRKSGLKAAIKAIKLSDILNSGSIRMVIGLVFCMLYVFAVKYVGFLFATPPLLAGISYLTGFKGWMKLAVGPIAITLVTTLLFAKLVNTPLPLGMIDFFRNINLFFA